MVGGATLAVTLLTAGTTLAQVSIVPSETPEKNTGGWVYGMAWLIAALAFLVVDHDRRGLHAVRAAVRQGRGELPCRPCRPRSCPVARLLVGPSTCRKPCPSSCSRPPCPRRSPPWVRPLPLRQPRRRHPRLQPLRPRRPPRLRQRPTPPTCRPEHPQLPQPSGSRSRWTKRCTTRSSPSSWRGARINAWPRDRLGAPDDRGPEEGRGLTPSPVDAAKLDWSMGSAAARLADWNTALDVGRRVAGAGSRAARRARTPPRGSGRARPPRGRIDPDFTGLRSRGSARAPGSWRRGEWIRRTSRPPAGASSRSPQRSASSQSEPSRSRGAGAQAGGLLGYVSRRCSASTTCSCRPTTTTYVLRRAERDRGGAEVRSAAARFRLWIAIHEVTHRVQFGADCGSVATCAACGRVPGQSCSSTSRAANQLVRAAEEAASRRPTGGAGRDPPAAHARAARACSRTQALMSLLEGHARYVMDEVARTRRRCPDAQALTARRRRVEPSSSFQRAIGFDQKIRQYDTGERFVRAIVGRARDGGFNLVWTARTTCRSRRDPRARPLDRGSPARLPWRAPPARRRPGAAAGHARRP